MAIIKGHLPKPKSTPPDRSAAEAMLGAGALLTELHQLKSDITTVVEKELTRVDDKISEVDKKVVEFNDTAVGLIRQIQNIPTIKGDPGLDADAKAIANDVLQRIPIRDEQQITRNVLAKVPRIDEEQLSQTILSRVPKLDESGLLKRFLAKVPKADLKVIQEKFETDPMSVIDKILSLPEGRFKLKTSQIDGLEQTISAFRNQITSKGYLHGGGDTLVAGTNITLVTNPNGTKTINASGGGTGTVTSVSVVTANGVSGSVANPTTTPAITLTLGAITPTSVNGITLSGTGSIANTGVSSLTTFVGSGTSSGTNTGDNTNAVNSAITNDTTTNATMYPVWVTANTGNLPLKVSSTQFQWNPGNPGATSLKLISSSFGLSGPISSPAWTTNGVRIKNVPDIMTDTTSTGTVAVAYTDAFGGNTIAATNPVTFTDYKSAFFTSPIAGTNVTITNAWGIGVDNLRVFGEVLITQLGTHPPNAPINQGFDLIQDQSQGSVAITNYGVSAATNSPAFIGQSARGTATSPAVVQTNDVLVTLSGRGYSGSAFSGTTNGNIRIVAAETWTSAHTGTYMAVRVTTKLGNTNFEALRVTDGRNIQIGAAFVYGISSSSDSSGTFDTNISRNAAGVLQVGTTAANALGSILAANLTITAPTNTTNSVVTIDGTQTLTNKRVTKRTGTTTSSATPTINTDNVDFYSLTAQTADITSFTTNLSGTPTENQTLWIAITGTAARAITWGTSFESSTVALPTTTVTTARLDVRFTWNTVTSKWRCIAVC